MQFCRRTWLCAFYRNPPKLIPTALFAPAAVVTVAANSQFTKLVSNVTWPENPPKSTRPLCVITICPAIVMFTSNYSNREKLAKTPPSFALARLNCTLFRLMSVLFYGIDKTNSYLVVSR